MDSGRQVDAQGGQGRFLQDGDNPVHFQVEFRAGVIDQAHLLAEMDRAHLLGDDAEFPLVDRGRGEPVVQVEGNALLEEDRELPALGTQPEAVFAAEGVHVQVVLLRGQGGPVDPAEAQSIRAAGRAGHDPALQVGIDRNLGGAAKILEDGHPGMLLQERQVVLERPRLGLGLGAFGTAHGHHQDGRQD